MDFGGIVNIPNWILILMLVFIGIYLFFTWNFAFFKSRGIPGPEPKFPLGNFDLSKPILQSMVDDLKKYGKVYGSFFGRKPRYSIADPDILKRILVKDFSTFVARNDFYMVGTLGHSVFHAPEKDWKRIRSLLTPAFSTGRIRKMEQAVVKNTDILISNIEDHISCNKNNVIPDIRKFTRGFTMDVIASTAFGLQIDSQKNENDPFVKYAGELLGIEIDSWVITVAVFLDFLAPFLDWLGVRIISKSMEDFFRGIVKRTVQQRSTSDNKDDSKDLLSLMIAANKLMDTDVVEDDPNKAVLSDVKQRKGLSEDELLANAMLIFAGGFDTTANTAAFMLHCLAVHTDIQEKLYAEIKEAVNDHDAPTYDMVNQLPYLEMCLSETLRMFPIVFFVDRKANKDIQIQNVFIAKNMSVGIPIYAIHHDDEVWPEPEKFDPERFTAEARAARSAFSYLPFGVGPRQCLGMRLAMMELKMLMACLLMKFQFSVSDETEVPIKLKKFAAFICPEGRVSLKIQKR